MPNTIPLFVFTFQGVGMLPSPLVGAYTYPYMPPLPRQSNEFAQYKVNSGANFVNSMFMHDLEPKEQEESGKELMVNTKSTEAQQMYNKGKV